VIQSYVAVTDILQAVLKSLILFSLAGTEASTVRKPVVSEVVEVVTAGVLSVATVDAVVAVVATVKTESPEADTALVSTLGIRLEAEADAPVGFAPFPILSAQVDTLEAVVLAGTFDCAAASDTVLTTEAAEVVVMGFIGMGF
jgi:hypothetical protein